jgi:predicted KAP-like P-loop ATPase
MMTGTRIAGELHGLSAHPGDIYHRAAMTVERLLRERDEARAVALEEAAKVAEEFNGAKHAAHDIATGVFPKKSFIGEAVAAAIRALKEPVASLRKAGLAKPNCSNLEGGKHD